VQNPISAANVLENSFISKMILIYPGSQVQHSFLAAMRAHIATRVSRTVLVVVFLPCVFQFGVFCFGVFLVDVFLAGVFKGCPLLGVVVLLLFFSERGGC
jgi:hypothetical protein